MFDVPIPEGSSLYGSPATQTFMEDLVSPLSVARVGQAGASTTKNADDAAAFQADLSAFEQNTRSTILPAWVLGGILGYYSSKHVHRHLALKGLGLSFGGSIFALASVWSDVQNRTLKNISPVEAFALKIPVVVGNTWTALGIYQLLKDR